MYVILYLVLVMLNEKEKVPCLSVKRKILIIGGLLLSTRVYSSKCTQSHSTTGSVKRSTSETRAAFLCFVFNQLDNIWLNLIKTIMCDLIIKVWRKFSVFVCFSVWVWPALQSNPVLVGTAKIKAWTQT